VAEPQPEPFRPLPATLLWLVGAIALVEILLELADRGIIADPSLRSRVYMVGAFWGQLLRGAEPVYGLQPVAMFVSHAFLHGGFLHLAMNMAVLLALGRFTADRYGAGAILPVFLAGAVAGGAAFGLISASPIPMVGASGAVFAFLGVWTVWDWRRRRAHGATVRPVAVRVATLVGINVVMWVGLSGMLAWEAHLGGFLAGVVCGVILENRNAERARRARAEARRRGAGGPWA
jgi:membrane associated rhomboid family serine protease